MLIKRKTIRRSRRGGSADGGGTQTVKVGETEYRQEGGVVSLPQYVTHIDDTIADRYPDNDGKVTLPRIPRSVSVNGSTYTPDSAGDIDLGNIGGGSVNSVSVNGTTYTPDSAGDVDLGNIGGGGGSGATSVTFNGNTYHVHANGNILIGGYYHDADCQKVRIPLQGASATNVIKYWCLLYPRNSSVEPTFTIAGGGRYSLYGVEDDGGTSSKTFLIRGSGWVPAALILPSHISITTGELTGILIRFSNREMCSTWITGTDPTCSPFKVGTVKFGASEQSAVAAVQDAAHQAGGGTIVTNMLAAAAAMDADSTLWDKVSSGDYSLNYTNGTITTTAI